MCDLLDTEKATKPILDRAVKYHYIPNLCHFCLAFYHMFLYKIYTV